MNEEKWTLWKMQTSTKWSDIEDVLQYVNIDFIDYDHKTLVEYALKLNTLIDQLEEKFSLELVNNTKNIMTELYDYAVMHFHREELFMEEYHLPGIDEHKREHARILSMLKSALDDFNQGKIKVSQQLKEQVMDWLIRHINVIDFNYFDIENWSNNLVDASDWNEVKAIIRLTGIKDIDEQHQIFTTMAIDVLSNISKDPNEQLLYSEFKRFKEYAIFHFEYEHSFMEKYGITDTEEHLALHDYFIDQLDRFPNQILNDPSSITELKSWILKWWITHINSTDKETFAYKKWAYSLIDSASTIDDVAFLLRETHYKEIDYDHLHLMKLTLELNSTIENYNKKKIDLSSDDVKYHINDLFIEIYDVAFNHFEREKRIMRQKNSKNMERHLEEHRLILKKFNDLRIHYLDGRLYLSSNIKNMILEWWIEHTNTVDYSTFVHTYNDDTDNFSGGGWQ